MKGFSEVPSKILTSNEVISILGYLSVTLCSHYFCNFLKIYKYVSDNSKKCLSVCYFGILSVACLSVARLQPTPAYVEIFTKSKVYYPK